MNRDKNFQLMVAQIDLPVSALSRRPDNLFELEYANEAWLVHPVLKRLWARIGEKIDPSLAGVDVVIEDCRCALQQESIILMTIAGGVGEDAKPVTLCLQPLGAPEGGGPPMIMASSHYAFGIPQQQQLDGEIVVIGDGARSPTVSRADVLHQKFKTPQLFSVANRSIAESLRQEDVKILLQLSNDGFWEWNVKSGEILFSEHWYKATGQAPGERLRTIEDWIALVEPRDRDSLTISLSDLLSGQIHTVENEHRLRMRDGAKRWMSIRCRVAARDSRGQPVRVIGTCDDIDKRKRTEDAVHHIATHDTLTGLANRLLFQREVTKAIARSIRSGRSFSLLLLDLDRFKEINDTLGHPAGDEVLKQVAKRLRQRTRAGEVIARLGGDEFALLVPHVRSEDEGGIVASRIVDLFAQPLVVAGQKTHMGVSIGIANFPADASEPDALLTCADLALYVSKNDGRGTWRYFAPGMQEKATHRGQVNREIGDAIEQGHLELHYQPIISLGDLSLGGVEALIRWRHPLRGLIGPDQFLEQLERGPHRIRFNHFVLKTAIRDLAHWNANGVDVGRLHINMNPQMLISDDWTDEIIRLTEQANVEPGVLVIEVVENVLRSVASIEANLHRLRDKGIMVAIDDFGTGYSSFDRLQTMPIDILKIDRRFVGSRSGCKNKGQAIVSAIVALAENMDIISISEGVETREAMQQLQKLGSHSAQGFLFGRPMPAPELSNWTMAWQEAHCRDHGTDLLRPQFAPAAGLEGA